MLNPMYIEKFISNEKLFTSKQLPYFARIIAYLSTFFLGNKDLQNPH